MCRSELRIGPLAGILSKDLLGDDRVVSWGQRWGAVHGPLHFPSEIQEKQKGQMLTEAAMGYGSTGRELYKLQGGSLGAGCLVTVLFCWF